MTIDPDSLGQEVMNLPLGHLVHSLAMAIADAQIALDRNSLGLAEAMSGHTWLPGPNGQPSEGVSTKVFFGTTIDEDGNRVAQEVSMLELGFVPNFYHFVDTVIDIKLAMRVNKSKTVKGRTVVTTTPVDAAYAASYNYRADMACVFKTKLAPVPPPAALDGRIQELLRDQSVPKVMPDLSGLTLQQAKERLRRLNIPFTVTPEDAADTAQLSGFTPAAGITLAQDQKAELTL